MRKKDREIVANVKEALMLLNEHDKDRVLAFSEGMMLMAKKNKEASWWKRGGVSNNKIGTVRNNSRNNSFLYKLLQIYVGR